ncbi:MAG: DUF2202 domain-containing protein [Minisyncoccia bacterium]
MKNNKNIILGIIGIIVLVLVSFYFMGGNKKLSGTEFIEKYNSTPTAVLLDVRTPDEFSSGHIDKAINIDIEAPSFVSEIKKLDTSKTYFVYCRSGSRSGQAVSIMKSSGIKNIYELNGGLISNIDTVKLVTVNSVESEYVVDSSDMVDGQTLISGIKKSVLSDNEIAGLIQMREEEKLARDVYTTLGSIWGTRIFSNISASEQTHTDAVKVLLTKYDIDDPVASDAVGVFTSKSMQDLYNTLITKGKTSLVEALVVGATVEDLDIRDLEILKKETTKEDILITYNNLQKGSRNHMRAFVKSIQANGGSYTPRYISQSDYNSIIATPQERGI